MATTPSARPDSPRTQDLRATRQIREYTDEAVSEADLAELLEVARWSGSSQNTQPWHFLVLTDPEDLAAVASARDRIAWVAKAPLAIALIMDGKTDSELYDEGRVTERLLIAARLLGLGAGTAWINNPEAEADLRNRFAIPPERGFRSVVVIGHPLEGATHRLGRTTSGRKAISEVVSRGRLGS